ncbi:uncharacterized protein ARMOST_16212 [Armillaria ostoyae]|uniref:Uncharacterized protein n=1 Tax=Armillaria ostoyae TaxID=47428 RepID=A0A284RVL4_ARMOS|nr:uncharacterized protein ARMOST_16212 [Armillaria ostoyae]
MNNIIASASKENPKLFGSVSIRGQLSCREIYNYFNFTIQHSNLNSETLNSFNSLVETSYHQQTGIFNGFYNNLVPNTLVPQPMNSRRLDSLNIKDFDKEEINTPTHTLHHCNLDDNPSDNQPSSPNGSRGPSGPNNYPNKQDFL